MPNTNAKSDYTNNQVAETVNVLHIYVKSRWIRLKLNCTNLSLELHISDVELHARKNPGSRRFSVIAALGNIAQ